MNELFDHDFARITALKWRPWVGKDYQPAMPLILGESYYDDHHGWLDNSAATRQLVQAQGLDAASQTKPSKFFRQVESTIFSKPGTTPDEQQHFWNSVTYMNLVQELLSGRNARPSKGHFDTGWRTFFQVVDILKPNVVVRFGKAGLGRLGFYLNQQDTGWQFSASEFYEKSEPVINLSRNGHDLKIIVTNHPSGSFGYNYQKWARVIRREVPALSQSFA